MTDAEWRAIPMPNGSDKWTIEMKVAYKLSWEREAVWGRVQRELETGITALATTPTYMDDSE